MPIIRYRDDATARRDLMKERTLPLSERLRSCWRFFSMITPPNPPRGVLKFHSIEEANEERRQRDIRRIRALRRERVRPR